MSIAAFTPNLANVVAVLAVIASVAVVYLARRSETLKLQASLRTSAYVDFVRGVAGLAICQKDQLHDKDSFQELRRFTMLVADAKARIAIYGSPVQRLASFVRKGAVLDTPERWKEFAAICQAFRRDGRPKLGKIPDEDMTVLLFK